MPKYAGNALWCQMLLKRIESEHNLLDKAYYLPKINESITINNFYLQLRKNLLNHISQCYNTWVNEMNQIIEINDLDHRLNKKLLKKDMKTSLISSNFDKYLLKLFQEVLYWSKFHGEHPIPYKAIEICKNRKQLLMYHQAILSIVFEYNRIMKILSIEQKELFLEYIQYTDYKINPGIHKYKWIDKNIKKYYIESAKNACKKTYIAIIKFNNNHSYIKHICQQISSYNLIEIEKNTIYDDYIFKERQLKYQLLATKQLTTYYQQILATMQDTYLLFQNQSKSIHLQWKSYIHSIDNLLEKSLCELCFKSLQSLLIAVTGDIKAKSEPHSLFRVNMILNNDNKATEFQPSVDKLSRLIKEISKNALSIIKVIPKLIYETSLLKIIDDENAKKVGIKFVDKDDNVTTDDDDDDDQNDLFFESIKNDKRIIFTLKSIFKSTKAVAIGLAKIIEFYIKHYQHIWKSDKDEFIERYKAANRPLSAFDVDIQRYRHLQTDIQHEETIHNVSFIRVDCSLLKVSLGDHCIEWQNRLALLLHQIASDKLYNLYNLFQKNSKLLIQIPKSLEELKNAVILYEHEKNIIYTITN